MRCAMCNRPLTVPALSIASRQGPLTFGPVCAKRAGLARKRERALTLRMAPQKPQHADERQADWVQQAQQGVKSAAGAVFGVGVVHG